MTARDEILRRVRTALADRPVPPPLQRAYAPAGSADPDIELFVERVADYRASVHRCASGDVAARIAEVLGGSGPVLVPDGFPADWTPTAAIPDTGQPAAELDAIPAVLTTCAVGIAVTGTIVLDHGPGQGRRALTLVPDHHVVVVRADQVVADVPDAVARLDPLRPMTWISGPSATSDIELNRVEGVHGPRTLDVVLVGAGPSHPVR